MSTKIDLLPKLIIDQPNIFLLTVNDNNFMKFEQYFQKIKSCLAIERRTNSRDSSISRFPYGQARIKRTFQSRRPS